VTRGVRHLQEERLFDHYLAEQHGEPIDPPSAEHLADCPACRERYADLVAFMSGLGEQADVELSAAFSSDDLRMQHQQIATRLEHLGHHARIISFPRQQPSTGVAGHMVRVAPRWLAAAAAAGLFVGIGLGSFVQSGVRLACRPAAPRATAARPTRDIVEPAVVPGDTAPLAGLDDAGIGAAEPNDDDFLSELETALDRPRAHELVALDDLTPRVREMTISNRIQ